MVGEITEPVLSLRHDALARFRAGGVIPAHPLALTAHGSLDVTRQRALSRYYIEAGAAGLAVAVHTTQFAIHDGNRDLLQPVLSLAAEVAAEYPERSPILVAGVSGPTNQAVETAALAADLGYHLCLLAPYGVGDAEERELLERTAAVGEVMPVVGFYLQRAVGGRYLSREFWRQLADIPTVVGIKAAPFDRYATLDVLHGVAASQRSDEIALYTGNDDNIVVDLVTTLGYRTRAGLDTRLEMVGGLLGQWAVWVRGAVSMLELARAAKAGDGAALQELIQLNPALTDANGVLFDARNSFRGCIAGIHEALRRQGLLDNLVFLDPRERLSPGQLEEIDRIWAMYPYLRDDDFVAENLDRWLR